MAAKIQRLATATQTAQRAAVAQGALATKTIMQAAAASKGVTSGSQIAGRRWSVRYDIKGTGSPTALVRFTGPFHLVNNSTQPHYIAAKGLGGSRASRSQRAFDASTARFQTGNARGAFGGQRRSRGGRALKIGDNFRAYVFHPGTQGKGIFEAGKKVAENRVPRVMASSMQGAWRKVIA